MIHTSSARNDLKKFGLHPLFTEDEVAHWFLPRENVVYAYVRDQAAKITDFLSFYALHESLLQKPSEKYDKLLTACLFYSVAGSLSWPALMTEALIAAKNAGFDVFNALDVMNNAQFLKETKFQQGTGSLYYYLYNWSCRKMDGSQVALLFPQ